MRLLGAELVRIRSRRMTWIVLVLGLCFIGLNTYAAYDFARPLPAAEQQQAQLQYEQAHADWVQNGPRRLEECRQAQAQSQDRLTCEDPEPQREWFGKPVSTVSSVWGQFRAGSGFFFGLLALLLGASYVGAEFSTGSMATWLTFEPRRSRVYVSKVAAPLLVTLVGGVLLAATLAGLSWAVINLAGGHTGLSATERSDIGWDALRLVGFLLLCGIGGAAAAFLLRHTAAVLGLVIGYGVLEQVFVGSVEDKARWSLMNNALAVLSGEHDFFWTKCVQDAQAQYACDAVSEQISAGQGFAVLGAVTAVTAVLAWWAFRRRDVA